MCKALWNKSFVFLIPSTNSDHLAPCGEVLLARILCIPYISSRLNLLTGMRALALRFVLNCNESGDKDFLWWIPKLARTFNLKMERKLFYFPQSLTRRRLTPQFLHVPHSEKKRLHLHSESFNDCFCADGSFPEVSFSHHFRLSSGYQFRIVKILLRGFWIFTVNDLPLIVF